MDIFYNNRRSRIEDKQKNVIYGIVTATFNNKIIGKISMKFYTL